MAKLTIEKVNTNKVEIIGKTYDTATFSGDVGSREKIKGQTFITEDEVEDNMTVRGEGKDSIVRKVEKKDKVEIAVQLLNAERLDDGKSLATAILKGVWTAKGVENDLDEIFVKDCGDNASALREIKAIADGLGRTPTGIRARGKWYPVDVATGKRVIIRLIGDVNNSGRIVDNCECGEPEL